MGRKLGRGQERGKKKPHRLSLCDATDSLCVRQASPLRHTPRCLLSVLTGKSPHQPGRIIAWSCDRSGICKKQLRMQMKHRHLRDPGRSGQRGQLSQFCDANGVSSFSQVLGETSWQFSVLGVFPVASFFILFPYKCDSTGTLHGKAGGG